LSEREKDPDQNLSMPFSDQSSYGDKYQQKDHRPSNILESCFQEGNRKWCLEIHAICLIFDIIRQSLALPLASVNKKWWFRGGGSYFQLVRTELGGKVRQPSLNLTQSKLTILYA